MREMQRLRLIASTAVENVLLGGTEVAGMQKVFYYSLCTSGTSFGKHKLHVMLPVV